MICQLLICPADDPTGTPVETWTDDDILDLRLEISLNDLGRNQVRIPRHTWEGSALDATQSYYVRVNVPYIDNDDPFWGFWLIGGDFILVSPDERGGEDVTIGGPGPAWVLTKAVLNFEEWTDHAGTYVEDGAWYWANKNYGQILTDLINEDAASDHPALDFMEAPGWNNTNDVDGNPWEDFPGIFSAKVGDSYLTVIRELQKADNLDVWVSPKLNIRAYVSYGRDLSGNSYGAGVVRFVGSSVTPDEPHNILGELTRHKDGGKAFTHVLALGKERREDGGIIEGSHIHRWAVDPDWSAGDEVHQGFLSYETSNTDILERAGLRLIRRSKDRSGRMLSCEVMPGQDEVNGLYMPGAPGTDKGDYWIGDIVTFKTGAGDDFDLNNRDLTIAKIKLQLDIAADDTNALSKERSWRTFIETGDDVSPSSTASSSSGCRCPTPSEPPDPPDIACEDLTLADLETQTTTNGNAENASGTQWSAVGGTGAYNTSHFHGGARSYGVENAAPEVDIFYDFPSGQVFESGTRYIVDCWQQIGGDNTGRFTKFGDLGTDEASGTRIELVGNWGHWRVCWTPSADRTGVQVQVHREQDPASSGADWAVVDDLQLYILADDGTGQTGVSNRYAREDHNHQHNDLAGRYEAAVHEIEDLITESTNADLVLHPDGAGGVEWGSGGAGGGAPDDATYLVTTAHADLSAEVVVGATPGGELGGTWASPTVDATHSGSAHHTENHASRHEDGGADELEVVDLATAETDTDKVLKPDGAGGVVWGTDETTDFVGSFIGKVPYAIPLGLNLAEASPSSLTLAAAGGSIMVPIPVTGPMSLQGYTLRNMNSASLRTAEARLYIDNGDSTADFVSGTDAAWSFTPGASSWRHAAVSGAPVSLTPGTYWLILRNTHGVNNFLLARHTPGNTNVVRIAIWTQTLASALGASQEMITGWTSDTLMPIIGLVGRVFGQTTAYFTE